MTLMTPKPKNTELKPEMRSLSFLNPRQVMMIDEALSRVGEFGEVRLIVERGRLRFLTTQNSFDVLKWRPSNIFDQER
ncbi:MAG: hypothetical protein IBX69_14035 [Anaerolineales bacterium]|nr:hypothetical protein [Anaerolineales bacterium]